MSLIFKFITTTSLVLGALASGMALSQEKNCDQSEKIQFITHDIFDPTEPDTIFLHRWANFLHIKTQPIALINESAFFIHKCQIRDEDLQELERYLRGKRFVRDAKVTSTPEEKIEIETWDNWSLMPTVDLGRKGGKNQYALGFQDRNLLGLGINAEVEYFSNDQRTGYKFKTQFPLYLNNNINAKIRLTSNDDGTSEAIFLQREFVSFDTQHAFKFGFDNFDQVDTMYENGLQSEQYRHQLQYSTVDWQWLHKDTAKDTLRFGLGYTREIHSFAELDEPNLSSNLNPQILPTDRSFNYPFVSVEYLQKDYRKLTNLNVINHIEDFNLGWNASASVGSDFSQSDASPALIWQSHLSKGVDLLNDAFWLFEASFEGEIYDNNLVQNRMLLQLNAEYFHKFNENWGGYFKNANHFSKNQFLDSPVALGGESGVRGYPLQYQHGKHSTQFTFEARYYPQINIYKLLELGGAAFIDTGRVFGQTDLSQNDSPWMTSVGLGARFYPTHSSESRVIHLDIIKPLTSAPNVNGVEFRITTKHTF